MRLTTTSRFYDIFDIARLYEISSQIDQLHDRCARW